jgi:hypothetical protein
MTQQQQAFSNIKEMVVALLGFDITNPAHKEQIERDLNPQLAGLMTALETQGVGVLSGRETVAVECRIILTQRDTEFTLHVWSPWTPEPGWTPAATPAVAQATQRTAAPAAAPHQGYPSASRSAPVYAPPAFASPALAPQQPAYPPAAPPGGYAPPAPAQAPVQVPNGQPAMPPAGVLPPWMTPK